MGAETDATVAARLAIAALIGSSVGFERQHSGHASGPQARFAGIRTFLLIGVLGGCAGLLLVLSQTLAATALLLGGMLFAIAAYVMAVRRPETELDGTTEAAALVVLVLGAIAGMGDLALAAGTGAVIVLALSEKVRLHWLVQRVEGADFRAGLQFAVLALVILPLLPAGPIGGALELRPRSLWTVVLLFSGLNFLGYLARRAAGTQRGYAIAGMLGGLFSSTAVAIGFSRRSRTEPALGEAFAQGVIGACVVLLPRVLVVSAVLNPAVALALLPLLIPALVLGAIALALMWRRHPKQVPSTPGAPANPLQLWTAIRMAIAFQIALSLIAIVRTHVDSSGLYATGAALGLTDVDALTFAMTRAGGDITAAVAARAIAIGILANTTLKMVACLLLGRARFRRLATIGLAGLALGSVIGLAFV
ncbi:MAG TPA: MgtC/SapB family protein [Gemmatimonadaceae bacterium]